jgi:hypothetical protein
MRIETHNLVANPVDTLRIAVASHLGLGITHISVSEERIFCL